MSRARFLAETDALIARGEELVARPDWDSFRSWLIDSDRVLERVWGRMDRYHLAWLNVGRGSQPAGTQLDEAERLRFVSEMALAKLGVLRTMRSSVEQRGWRTLSEEDA
jgi:hypothetical protein